MSLSAKLVAEGGGGGGGGRGGVGAHTRKKKLSEASLKRGDHFQCNGIAK